MCENCSSHSNWNQHEMRARNKQGKVCVYPNRRIAALVDKVWHCMEQINIKCSKEGEKEKKDREEDESASPAPWHGQHCGAGIGFRRGGWKASNIDHARMRWKRTIHVELDIRTSRVFFSVEEMNFQHIYFPLSIQT